MNAIALRVVTTPLDYGPGIEIRIDGEDLVDMVRGVELPFAQAEGHPGIAGAYAGLPARDYSPPSRHFWGEAEGGRRDGRVVLLTCRDCGEIGCWPLLARLARSCSTEASTGRRCGPWPGKVGRGWNRSSRSGRQHTNARERSE